MGTVGCGSAPATTDQRVVPECVVDSARYPEMIDSRAAPVVDGRRSVAVIVSVRNEADRLAATVGALREAFGEVPIVVADDHSSDGSGAVARAAGADVVRAPRHLGKGGAATLAAERLLRADAPELVILCDGDLGRSARELGALLRALPPGAPAGAASAAFGGSGDLVVAAFRHRVGGGFGIALRFARWALRDLAQLELAAPISGQRVLRGDVLAAVLPFARGFGMEIGMTVDASRAGYRVVEVELDLEHRASRRTWAGFVHRGRQLADFARVYLSRRGRRRRGRSAG